MHYRHLQMLPVKGLLEVKEYNSVVSLNMERSPVVDRSAVDMELLQQMHP